MYRSVDIIDDYYIVQTPDGFKKVKISKPNKKNARDKIKSEKL